MGGTPQSGKTCKRERESEGGLMGSGKWERIQRKLYKNGEQNNKQECWEKRLERIKSVLV